MATLSSVKITLAFLLAICLLSHYSEAFGGLLGGRTKLKNLKTDKEIQDLGRYAVERYNTQKGIYIKNGSTSTEDHLKFQEVVEAEKQVVSGIKYYLKITAVTKSGTTNTFNAVLMVTPWKNSKQLLRFTPSHSPAVTK
ncbi:cysteine proteinase inhibitor B-like [Impatiens glandulifera]|uniref:cysteine proteinase inhibitor B-like n=1 Tax=Impatiens glandulifera TaxID=253017 RepID=UPI001FB09DD9|nr:cysteine proteinase inhibitor B-like [Impatiens glandulifera]